jgi:Tfp pilus assembly protein PilN
LSLSARVNERQREACRIRLMMDVGVAVLAGMAGYAAILLLIG